MQPAGSPADLPVVETPLERLHHAKGYSCGRPSSISRYIRDYKQGRALYMPLQSKLAIALQPEVAACSAACSAGHQLGCRVHTRICCMQVAAAGGTQACHAIRQQHTRTLLQQAAAVGAQPY
jgi:hypothetical protein